MYIWEPGNYNDSTAKLYTDCGLITCHPLMGEDATAVFNMLSGYSEPPTWNPPDPGAVVAAQTRCVRMIRRETARAREGKPAHIMAKMNSLCDREIIACLYEASCAGVKIELVVRGICCLKAGVPGLSENILRCIPLWEISWNMPGSSILRMVEARRFTWEVPTGCRVT